MDFVKAMLIPIAGGVAYLLTFTYEAGFVAVFRIPIEVVKVNLSTIFVVASALIVSLPLLWWVLSYIAGSRWTSFRIVLLVLLVLIVCLALFQLYSHQGKEQIRIIVGASLLVVCLSFVIFTVLYLKPTQLSSLQDPRKSQTVFIIGLLLVVLAVCTSFAVGRNRALAQTHFLIPEESPDLAVLRFYGDILVCTPFDRETHKVGGTFVFRKVSEGNLRLNLERVGPLVFVNQKENIKKKESSELPS